MGTFPLFPHPGDDYALSTISFWILNIRIFQNSLHYPQMRIKLHFSLICVDFERPALLSPIFIYVVSLHDRQTELHDEDLTRNPSTIINPIRMKTSEQSNISSGPMGCNEGGPLKKDSTDNFNQLWSNEASSAERTQGPSTTPPRTMGESAWVMPGNQSDQAQSIIFHHPASRVDE